MKEGKACSLLEAFGKFCFSLASNFPPQVFGEEGVPAAKDGVEAAGAARDGVEAAADWGWR